MIVTAQLLLQYLRCKRRTFLDTHGDLSQRDAPSELLVKLQQDRLSHRKTVLAQQIYRQPDYFKGDWEAGAKATLELMQQGIECIYKGVLLVNYSESTLLSRPDLLFKQPGKSRFGDWVYVSAQIELGKRPKLEYQIAATFHSQVLAVVQETTPEIAWLLLRRKQGAYTVNVSRWMLQMQQTLDGCIQSLDSSQAPEVFISRQRCSLCRWFTQCYAIAKSEHHLSLIPGVTPSRYTQLQSLNLADLTSIANANPAELEGIPGFEGKVAQKLVLQAQSVVENRPIFLSAAAASAQLTPAFTAPVEIYFDIEAEPDLHLDYMLGVLVVDRQAKTETFYSLLAEQPEAEELIWQQFLDLVWQYPQAPIFHFCAYEVDTVKRLAKLYQTPRERVLPVLERFVDVYEQVTQTVALPVESYALKAIARWLGFEWRDLQASGSQAICWYDNWLETGDHTFLEAIQRYNEDDCRATYRVKDWFVNFVQDAYALGCDQAVSR